MSLAVIFGINLRNCRKAKRLTQADLAEKVSLSTEMISKIERGVAAPSFINIEKIAAILEIPESDLFSNEIGAFGSNDRLQILLKINSKISRLNDEQLARIEKLIAAFMD